MGLFNRKKKTISIPVPTGKGKAIYEYKMMESVNCDLEAALSNPHPDFMDFCKIIAENEKYRFCSYKAFEDNSGGYVIRQSKANPSEKLFFGENFQMACIYKSYLFQSAHSGERGRFYIFAKNIETGNVIKCDWLGKGDIFVNINGYGRYYVQDTITDFCVENDQLIFHIKREKSNNERPMDKYDIDTEYILKVTIENGQLKPVAIFDIAPEVSEEDHTSQATTSRTSPLKTRKMNTNALGWDEDKHILYDFEGHEDSCPKDCNKRAISIKTDGDIALANNDLELAIKQYKKAVFIEPRFAEAWVNMGNAYCMHSEYNNAISSFNKAIAIDPIYGKALFGKAIALRNLGSFDEAMALANEILELYDDDSVEEFKKALVNAGVKDKNSVYSLENVVDIMTDEAYKLTEQNKLLDADGNISTECEIYCKEAFARSIFLYCKKQYNSLGNDKIWSESIISAFYGSICTTLLYYNDSKGFEHIEPFDYLCDHVDIDDLERNAEKLLHIRQNEEKAEGLWNLIYSFVKSCKTAIKKLEEETDIEAAVIDASESAYILGMLVAMRHNEAQRTNNRVSLNRDSKNITSDMEKIPAIPSLPVFSSKKLSDYKALEQIEVTDESPSNASNVYSKLIAETDDYYIYSCSRKDDYSRHIIRQSKYHPSDIVYLTYEFESLCYFNGQLFYKTHEYWGGNELYSVDVASGKHTNYKWFSDRGYAIIDVVVGQDLIKSVYVKNGKLIVDVSRTKSNFHLGEKNKDDGSPFDITMDYTLCAGLQNGKYYLSYFYKDIDVSRLQTIYHAPRNKWHVATAHNMYYLINNNKKVAKTRAGTVLDTSYLKLAKRMAEELEQYGENVPEMTLLSLQMNMRDNVVQCSHKEIENGIFSYFEGVKDWTYGIRGDNPAWNKLFGNKISRKSALESWLSKTTHMQMNAVIMLGKKYKSLNLAFILALLVEKIPVTAQLHSFTKLANYIKKHSSHSIERKDFEVFTTYYGIHFESEGSTIDDESMDIDINAIFNI